jgi:pyridoxine 5-phosphate synthase
VTRLSVNVNKIATLRNTRGNTIPDLAELAALALAGGADGITVHPRPDERHIRASDVPTLAAVVARFPGAEFNIEGNPFHGLIEHCARARPTQATLVPDAREALTSNHGWSLSEMTGEQRTALATSIGRLRALGCRVSLFVDPIPELMPLARDLGTDRVELFTEPYAALAADGRVPEGLSPYVTTAAAARAHGLGVNAGHDLNLDNLGPFLDTVRQIDEVSIGHALIADALVLGLGEVVRRYLAICAKPRD